MSEDEIDFVVSAQIGLPVPAKDAFDADHDIVNKGKDQFEKAFAIGFDVLVDQDLSLSAEDADKHFPGMQIDAVVILVLPILEFHDVASFG